jgi:hypothetical protein
LVERDCQTLVLESQLKLIVSFAPNPPALTFKLLLTAPDDGVTDTAAGPLTVTFALAVVPLLVVATIGYCPATDCGIANEQL